MYFGAYQVSEDLSLLQNVSKTQNVLTYSSFARTKMDVCTAYLINARTVQIFQILFVTRGRRRRRRRCLRSFSFLFFSGGNQNT